MNSALDFYVFDKWASAPAYAFGDRHGEGVVPPEDKDAYWRIYSELLTAAEDAKAAHPHAERLFLRPKRYSQTRGSRGHRPIDLWVSICAEGAELLGYMPQVYAIASHRGLEIGFAVSIAEDDYFDVETKQRNRTIVPFINSKLPNADSLVTQDLDRSLRSTGGWTFNLKTRLLPNDPGFNQFSSLEDMLGHLKSEGAVSGGGTISRIFPAVDLARIDLDFQFQEAVNLFAPLLSHCAPTPWDIQIRVSQEQVDKLSVHDEAPPTNEEQGRRKVLAEVARRQGQARFRSKLLEAYNGACAISGTNVPDTLQAAHILPYNGPSTNHVSNGLLLRADLHTLFDLKLITVDPKSHCVLASPRLRGTEYWQFQGRELRSPERRSDYPAASALEWHYRSAIEGKYPVLQN